jgi:TolB protein
VTRQLVKLIAVISVAVLTLADAFAGAQEQRPAIEITPGRARAFRVAVQRFVDNAEPVNNRRAEDLRTAIGEALEFTGVLLPLDRAAYLAPEESGPLSNRGRSDCIDWTQSGADALVEGEIRSESGVLVVEFAVWDTARCIRLERKTVRRVRTQAPLLARMVADQIVAAFTGTPGSAATELAFVSDRSGHREIYVMDADGGNPRPATRSDVIKAFPDWLPSGEALIYTSYTKAGQPGLFVTSRGSVRPGVLFQSLMAEEPVYRGVVGPRGSYMALVAGRESDIYSIRRDGSRLQQLTRTAAIEVGPSWSPDGERIAFVSDRSGAPQIYVMDRDGGNVRRITFNGNYNTSPAWSPDGRWIAYESQVAGQFDIWLVDPTGEVSVPLVTHRLSDESPAWSPGGRKLVFSSNRRGKADLYVMDVNGENIERLTRDQGDNLSPAWGPFPPETRATAE